MGFTKQVAKLNIAPERTFRVTVLLPHPLAANAAVFVRYAGPGNTGFINADKKKPVIGGPDSETKDRLEREIDAPIFAEHVITGWENVYEDDATEPCVFSRAKAEELLLALASSTPADQFYRIANSARMLTNFRDAIASTADLGKG